VRAASGWSPSEEGEDGGLHQRYQRVLYLVSIIGLILAVVIFVAALLAAVVNNVMIKKREG
jgi:hypothetical protein